MIYKNNELFLFGAHISPLRSASSHVDCDPIRTRKLLLNKLEINRLREKITQKGATVVPLKLYWARGKVKLEIGVAKGKKSHDLMQTLMARYVHQIERVHYFYKSHNSLLSELYSPSSF